MRGSNHTQPVLLAAVTQHTGRFGAGRVVGTNPEMTLAGQGPLHHVLKLHKNKFGGFGNQPCGFLKDFPTSINLLCWTCEPQLCVSAPPLPLLKDCG